MYGYRIAILIGSSVDFCQVDLNLYRIYLIFSTIICFLVFNLKTRSLNGVVEVDVVSHIFVMNSQCLMNSGNQFCYLLCSYDRMSWNLDFTHM